MAILDTYRASNNNYILDTQATSSTSTNNLVVASSAVSNTTPTAAVGIVGAGLVLVSATSNVTNTASTPSVVTTLNNLKPATSAQIAISSFVSTASTYSTVNPNMRIIYNNLAQYATVTTDTTAGALVATNLQSDIKSDVWRATTTSGVITGTFTTTQTVSGVCLAFTNLTQVATIRVQLYSDAAATTQIFDSTAKPACPAVPVTVQGFQATNNIYGYGGGAYASIWFTQTSGVRAVKISLSDASNPSGYIEASRLILGTYFAPVYNPDFGVTLSHLDLSKPFRTDAGDLLTDIGTRYRRISLNLSVLTTADRTALTSIIRSNGLSTPMLLSLYPQNPDNELERDHMIYGKLSAVSGMATPYYNTYSMPFDLEEI